MTPVYSRIWAWRFWLIALISWLIVWEEAGAVTKKKPASSSAAASRPVPAAPETRRSRLPVLTALAVGPGQAGYVHYFLLTHPGGTLEYQVGIELGDQRIAWSFPGLGVAVSPFVASGSLTVNGADYAIEHLYGIRPFPDDARMKVLREEITNRVALWIDDETPYCVYRTRGGPFCVSCGDFVVRVLFPGRTHLTPALPRDFFRAPPGAGFAPSTDDLLFYLVGLNELPNQEARLKRVAELSLPQALREDLAELLGVEPAASPAPDVAKAPRATPRRLRAGTRPAEKVVQKPPSTDTSPSPRGRSGP